VTIASSLSRESGGEENHNPLEMHIPFIGPDPSDFKILTGYKSSQKRL